MVATGMALVLAAALLALLATPPVDAASSYRVVTKTFSNPSPECGEGAFRELHSGPVL